MLEIRARWLIGEIPGLVRGGVLPEEAADSLRRHYESCATRGASRVRQLLFAVLGSGLIGSGVLLLLAHNWEELTRPVRGAISLGLLGAAQLLGGWVLARRPDSTVWRESSAAFLALAVGTSLALVLQTYQVQLDVSEYLLAWVLLTVPVVYLFHSRVVAALVWIGTTAWFVSGDSLFVGRGVETTHLLALAGLVLLSLPYLAFLAVRHGHENRTALVFAAAASGGFASLLRLATETQGSAWWILLMSGYFAALYGLGVWARTDRRAWSSPLWWMGAIGAAITIWSLGFPTAWGSPASFSIEPEQRSMLAVVIGLAVVAGTFGVALLRRRDWLAASFTALPFLAGAGVLTASQAKAFETPQALVFSAYGLVLGIATCLGALRRGSHAVANAGFLFAAAILAARFFDDQWSFQARGVGFILLGAGFLALNAWILSRRREVVV